MKKVSSPLTSPCTTVSGNGKVDVFDPAKHRALSIITLLKKLIAIIQNKLAEAFAHVSSIHQWANSSH